MENKKWHKLVFLQLQPIHIGYKKHGVVNETRIFIPGWTMWGALTNAYFKKTGNYEENVFEKITCFYPMIKDTVLYPKYENGEFCLGDKSEKEFRQEYVITNISTAINPSTLNAKDESLHETDVILPKNKIKWVGYIDCDENEIKQIEEIFVGGDSRYGLGLMGLMKSEEINDEELKRCMITQEDNSNSITLRNYLKFNGKTHNFTGKIELLCTFDFKKKTPVVEEKSPGFYITPGSVFSVNTFKNTKLIKGRLIRENNNKI